VFKAVNNALFMRKKIFSILILFTLSFTVMMVPVFAQNGDTTLNGLNQTANEVGAFQEQTGQTNEVYGKFIQTKAGQIVGFILSFIGILFLILTVYAGIMWMTANGNEEQVRKARTLIINAIIGIVIVFAAYAITSLIGSEVIK